MSPILAFGFKVVLKVLIVEELVAILDSIFARACLLIFKNSCNSKVNNFELDTLDVQLATLFVFWWLRQHNILKLHIPMDDFTIMAIIYSVQELNEKVIRIFL